MSYVNEKQPALLAIAYLQLNPADGSWINAFRKKHDHLYYGEIDPHFTLVFPTSGISPDDFVCEISSKSVNLESFNFVIRSAMTNNDRLSEYSHIFLVPDEGNSQVVKIHDQLYSGTLKKMRKTDIDFISHVTVGSYTDPRTCIALVEEINKKDLIIKGEITSIDIVSFGSGNLQKLHSIELGRL